MEKIIIDKRYLYEWCKQISKILNEAAIFITKEGFKITHLDESNVMGIYAEIKNSRFLVYNIKNERQIVLNLPQFASFLEQFKEHVEIQIEENKLILKNKGIESEISLIDVETNNHIKPETDYEFDVEIDYKKFNQIIKNTLKISDSIVFKIDKQLTLEAENEFGNSIKYILPVKSSINQKIKKEISKYSLHFLNKLTNYKLMDNNILRFKTDYPLNLVLSNQSNDILIEYLLAPRVSN